MDPRDARTRLQIEIREGLLFMAGGGALSTLGSTLENLSEHLQALGICRLLETVDVDAFRDNLARSGHARRYFLRRCRAEQALQDRRLALGRTEAFLDALAAGQLGLARDIAALSVEAWDANWEYEEDFCYFLFLHRFVSEPARPALDVLETFERALRGITSTRLPVCVALANRDGRAFTRALQALLNERAEWFDRKRPEIVESDFLFWPRSFVCIESLALLQLANLVGIAVDGDLPMCPTAARLEAKERPILDFFDEIDRELRASKGS